MPKKQCRKATGEFKKCAKPRAKAAKAAAPKKKRVATPKQLENLAAGRAKRAQYVAALKASGVPVVRRRTKASAAMTARYNKEMAGLGEFGPSVPAGYVAAPPMIGPPAIASVAAASSASNASPFAKAYPGLT